MDEKFLPKKEKRDTPVTVRIPNSVFIKLKDLSGAYSVSQSELIEGLVCHEWNELENKKSTIITHTKRQDEGN